MQARDRARERTIITGGTGLIGRALAAELVASGHAVVVLSRSPIRVTGMPPGVEVRRWDGRTAAGWGALIEDATAIVHLAGEGLADGRWTSERKRRIRESRLQAGQAVVDAVLAARRKPHVLVQASGVGYYGPHGDEVVTEETAVGTDFLAQLCVAWEDSTAMVETLGVRRTIIRTGLVLSPSGGALPRLLLPFRLFAGGPLGNGNQWYPWIHIADEVSAIRFLIEHGSARGPFNLAAPNPVTNAELSTVLGRLLKRPSRLRTPALALRLALGEMSTVVLEGQRAIPKRLTTLGFRFRFSELEPALRDVLP